MNIASPISLLVALVGCSKVTGDTAECTPREEVAYDGQDQDCDGADLVDVDGDGHAGVDAGGSDCDDTDPNVSPTATDLVGDGIDQNCDGADGLDDDGDGWASEPSGGADCDDTDPEENHDDVDGDGYTSCDGDCDDGDASVSPAATDLPYDGVDQDCDGDDLVDVDGDGANAEEVGGTDCDDTDRALNQSDEDQDGFSTCEGDCDDDDPSANPGATEVWYDDVDQDCAGDSDHDADGDGFDRQQSGGVDCNDRADAINPDAEEIPYDGIDNDCADGDLDDLDGDGYSAEEAGGNDCDDDDPEIRPGAEDIPYDGIDQNCFEGDLTDVDEDGFDALSVGGSDCDDEDEDVSPGAEEIPYDGIDNDCDGSDLTDVDGDGYDASILNVGGEDCDDDDASVNPGASETDDDGVDNDCDGYADELSVCADGTGHHTTIQDGIDGAADGGALELCAGTYSEDLVVSDMILTIYGGGAHPNDVVIDNTAGSDELLVEGASDVTLEWLTLLGGQAGAFEAEDVLAFRLDYVDLCGSSDEATNTYAKVYAAEVSVTDSRFCADDGSGTAFGLAYSLVGDSTTFSQNLVSSGSGWLTFYFYDADIQNNIFYDGHVYFDFEVGLAATVNIENNHFVDLDSLYLHFDHTGDSAYGWMGFPDIFYYSNIFSDLDVSEGTGAIWRYYASSYSSCCPSGGDITDIRPDDWNGNIVHDNTGFYTYTEWVQSYYGDDYQVDTGLGAELLAASTLEDPLFAPDTGGAGSYALDPASPAVDAGVGDPDADGTPNDIGAFGGPEGDWWKETPWPLP